MHQRNEEDFLTFQRQLSGYEDYELRLIYEHFHDDLTYIVELLDTHRLLAELHSRNIPNMEHYKSMRKDLGASAFAGKLVTDILEGGREAVVGFWESLLALQKFHGHPSMAAVLSELIHTGDSLKQSILLDTCGHSLTPELSEIQKQHKDHLLRETQTLVENKPPGTNMGQKHFSICERYVNLTVITAHHFRPPSQDELTQNGEQLEGCLQKKKGGLQNIVPKRLFHWCHKLKSEPRVVMVNGVPGVGKTTLMQKFVYDWVGGKHYQRFSFVFFFKFRELNRLKEITLEDLILRQYPYLQSQLGNILQEPEQLLFLFDGLDESVHQMDFQSSTFCVDTKQAEQLGVIVVSLIKQALLKGCSVLMTSRPSKLLLIGTDADIFQRMVKIMGFFSKEIEVYFERFFEDKELSAKALRYVQENETLYTFCYIPAYCWIICTVLSMCFKAQPRNYNQLLASLPKTVTQLFVIFVANILANHTQDEERAAELLMPLGQIAEHGVFNQILVFDERDLGSFHVDTCSHLLSSFMIAFSQNSHVTFSFMHFILQEFLAALIHYLKFTSENLEASLEEAKSYQDGRSEIFLRFICGLSDITTRAILKPYVGELSIEASNKVIKWLGSVLEEQLKDRSHKDMRRLLNVFFCLFESRNKDLVSKSLKSFKSFDFFRVYFTPLNCAVLSYVLNCCEETEKLHLNECSIRSEGLERLKPALHTIGDISLSSNYLKDRAMNSICFALTHPQCKIKKLNLSDNGLTDTSCILLASGIKANKTLRSLDLSHNHLVGPDFSHLVEVLSSSSCQIEELGLRGNGLTNSSCVQLASVIGNAQSLRKLDISYNNLEGPNFTNVIEALSGPACRIQELQLRYTGLSECSFAHLASWISKSRSLKTLDLSENNLTSSRFYDLIVALCSGTCKIEELKLCGITMTDEQAPLLGQLRHNSSLRYLELSNNTISDASAGYIEELILGSTSLQEIRLDIKRFSAETRQILKELKRVRPGMEIFIWGIQ